MINNDFRMDSHKLIYHIPRLHKWLDGEDVYPIYLEIGLYGGCNHRCIFCAFDFLNYKTNILSLNCLKKFIPEMQESGIKSILYSGEGEPLLHPDASEIIQITKNAGIDVALSTNGIFLNGEIAENMLQHLSWLRISIDAFSDSNYALVHGTDKKDFTVLINNVKQAVDIKKRNKYSCTIGAQLVLIPQNYKEVLKLAGLLENIGLDYLVIKPYLKHPSSKKNCILELDEKKISVLDKKLKILSGNNFQVIFRRRAVEKLNRKKPYINCLGFSFSAHITAEGDIYPCNAFVGKNDFSYGNLNKDSFKIIWGSQRRRNILERIYQYWDLSGCRKSCRLDEINRYLWELKHPVKHVNFI